MKTTTTILKALPTWRLFTYTSELKPYDLECDGVLIRVFVLFYDAQATSIIMSFKPVYVPKSKRQRSGGTPQHRRPINNNNLNHFASNDDDDDALPPLGIDPAEALSKVQRPEDFMDEQDHNEWGGPTKVTAEFEQKRHIYPPTKYDDDEEDGRGRGTNNNPLASLTVRSLNVGERLLRKLGWREQQPENSSASSLLLTAYLPSTGKDFDDDAVDANTTTTRTWKVGAKHLRKIVLQQTRVAIPPPWQGKWGLGYQSELRRTGSTTTGNSHQYRFKTNVMVNASGLIEQHTGRHNEGNDGAGSSQPPHDYEATTLQDFVGTHSTAGFALREDDDDAYDDSMTNEKSFHSTVLGMVPSSRRPQKQVADPASMQMEAYEHEDSDSDDVDNAKLPHHKKKKKKAAAATTAANFAGALSSWAMGGGDAGTSTSTNRPSSSSSSSTLEGFVLGTTAGSTKPKLYRGPDVPREWHIVPHAFGPHEHPSILKAIAHATKLAVAQELRAQSLTEALQAATVAARVTTTTAAAAASRPQEQQQQSVDSSRRSIFAGIGEQMMNRFTAAASTTDNSNDITTTTNNNNNNNDDPLQPQEEGTVRNDTASVPSSPHPSTVDIVITRTVKPFLPETLLCKRLNVSGPKPLAGGDATLIPAIAPRRDEVFFQTQVLGAVAEETRKRGAETSSTTALLLLNNNDDDEEEADQPQRPPLNVYKSIFDPDNIANADDIESEANDDKESETSAIASGDVNNAAIVPYQDVVTNNNPPSPSLLPHTNATLVPFSNQKCDPDDRSESSASSSTVAEHEQRRQHRKRKHEKKSSKTKKAKKHHKKKSKKSRRRDDDS
jgi:hypothetical protein